MDPLYEAPDTARVEFAEWHRQAMLPQIRYVALLTTLLYFLYAAIEYRSATDQHGLRLTLHGLVVGATLLAVVLLSYRPTLHRLMTGLLMAAPVGAVAANLYLNSHNPDFAYYKPELYLNLMWTFAVSGLSLRQASLAAGSSVLLILATTLDGALPPGMQHLHLVWILAAFSFGLLSAFLLERAHKTMFLNQSQLALSASVDGLTGLWNRAHIDRLFDEELARARRYGTPFSVMLIDIDHFKQVNDNHGHTVGDTVLRQFAALLRDNVRSVDKVGRLGGEEFLILMPQVDAQQAKAAAQQLRKRIRAFEFDVVRHKTASFGITEYRGDATPHSMLDRVDRALYLAKEGGRDRIELITYVPLGEE